MAIGVVEDLARQCAAAHRGASKAMRAWLRVPVAVLLGAGCGCMNAPGSGPPVEWFPLQRELSVHDLNGLRASFTPTLSGEYSTTLSFRQPMPDVEIRDLVNRSASGIGIDETPVQFDFEWRVLRDEKVVARGTGRRGATGVVDTGSEGLGGGPLKSRALVFGKFTAEANRIYTIELHPGAELAPVLRSNPQLEVMLDPSSRR